MTDDDKVKGSGARMLSLIKLIVEGPQRFGLNALAERAQLSPSTVHRLLKVMVDAGFVERDGKQGYALGPELLRLGALVSEREGLGPLARPFLTDLWEKWQETVVLCRYRPQAGNAMVEETIATPHPLRVVIEPRQEISLAWGSLGRSILATLPDDIIERIVSRSGEGPLSGRPLPPRSELMAELHAIAEKGYALYDDKMADFAGVAAPVFRGKGETVGCIGVIFPSTRWPKNGRKLLADAVREAAMNLGRQLGHIPV